MLVAAALLRRSLRTDVLLAVLVGVLPFATSYGLIYWAEQYVTSGLAAVLFGVLPLYVALLGAIFLPAEPLRTRLLVGIGIAIGGLVLAFGESLDIGGEHAGLAAGAVVLASLSSAIGNVAIKLRAAKVDPLVMNGWAMLIGGVLLLAVSALTEDWGATTWSPASIGSILYLAAFGTGFTFVTLTVLLRELPAVTVSFISMIIPFGALALGAMFRDEPVTALAVVRRAAGGRRDRRRAVPAAPSGTMTACLRSWSSAPATSAARSSPITSRTAGAAPPSRARRRRSRPSAARAGCRIQADASDPEQLRAALEQAKGEFGRLDLIVNAVSAVRPGPGPAVRRRAAARGRAAGLRQVDGRRTRAQAFVFLSEGVRAGAGTLIQITGGSARRAMPGRGLWAAAAHATRAITHAAAQELRARRASTSRC